MAPSLPTRFVAGTLAGIFTLTTIPNGAAKAVHVPHVPEMNYVIPSNTSGTISASGAASRAIRPRGLNSGPLNGRALND